MEEQKTEKELRFEKQQELLKKSGILKKYKWGKVNNSIFNKKKK
jgi:hypothetical protein